MLRLLIDLLIFNDSIISSHNPQLRTSFKSSLLLKASKMIQGCKPPFDHEFLSMVRGYSRYSYFYLE